LTQKGAKTGVKKFARRKIPEKKEYLFLQVVIREREGNLRERKKSCGSMIDPCRERCMC
jgi:hypothetical protein